MLIKGTMVSGIVNGKVIAEMGHIHMILPKPFLLITINANKHL